MASSWNSVETPLAIAACGDPKRSSAPATVTRPRSGVTTPAIDLDQRRLARAVLAEQCVDLTRRDLEMDIVEHHGIAVRLADPFDGQDARRGSSSVPTLGTAAGPGAWAISLAPANVTGRG